MTRADAPAPLAAVDPAAAPQARYQVRFDTGADGLARISAGAQVVVWVDPLGTAEPPLDAIAPADPGAEPAVLLAGFVDAAATARWILDEQERLGRRAYLAVVAAGAGEGFAALDVLAAGAVVDALTTLGIDDTSPEAAVASAAFAGLRRAVRHLSTASAAGRAASAAGRSHEELVQAATLDASDAVRVVRAGATD
ncbi:2-phosphosulfolactate phosphatase [Agromyces sp. MMS24-K17]|uniref:2-phosphosulfolactate phosphatase n=1 Tax=Agromyces sp. MMS24-K17 TaxID=3372850 RepID=UPI003754F268